MLTGVIFVLLLLLVLLAMPLSLSFDVSWRRALHGHIQLQWAFGLLHFRHALSTPTVPAKEKKDVARPRRHVKRAGAKKPKVFAVIRQQALRRRMLRFAADCWRAFHKRDLSLRLRLGLGDPAETGQLWAVLGPLAGMLASVQQASIQVEPEFFDATFEVDGSGNIRLIPLQLLYLVTGLLLSPAVWRGLKRMRQGT
jgi:hypothetical protein